MSVPTKTRRFVIAGARYVLAGVFLASAIGKGFSPSTFIQFVSSIPWLTWVDPLVVLAVVVIAESAISILFIIPRTSRFGAVGALGALVLFSGILVYNWYVNPDQECGCFGGLAVGMTTEIDIVRNLVLALLCGFIMEKPSSRNSSEQSVL
jgi:uncharacterized membrane protein YphA (DoxX/SURF4 family)